MDADGLAELLTLTGVVKSLLESALCNAQCLCGDADAAAVEGSHGDLEALALLAQQVLLGHLHIVEDQLSGGGGANAHLVIVIAELETLPALLHDERGDAAGADVGSGDGEHHVGVGLGCVGDEDLAAVEEIVIALIYSGGLRAACIGACVGLGEAESADLLALGQRH